MDEIGRDSDAYVDLVTQLCEELCRAAGYPEDDLIIEAGFEAFDEQMKRRAPLDIARRAALGAMHDHTRGRDRGL